MPKRVNFINIQNSHKLAIQGSHQPMVRTGYENVIPHRTTDLFAYAAKQDGVVVSFNEHGMIVQYQDGTKKGITLGRRFGHAAGLTIPHEIISWYKLNDTFKAGDILAYNTGFFEEDVLNPRQLIMKDSVVIKTALMESTDTFEDSSAISKRVSELLTTKMTKVRNIVVNFDQSVHKLVKVNQPIKAEDALCIIEDAVTAGSGLFDEESLDTLKMLSNQSPTAKFSGVVERIEVFYHGEPEDMSDNLRSIIKVSDKEMAKRHTSIGNKPYTGSVDESFRIDGEPLLLDTLCIRIYITANAAYGIGDKAVFANQLKTVTGRVIEKETKTESGHVVDAIFGAQSVFARIVNSVFVIGTTNTILNVVSKKACEIYKK